MMKFKPLVIAGCSVLLPLSFAILRPNEAQAQASCFRNRPNKIQRYPVYYFDPNRQIGCYQGWWHRYNGTPSFENTWGAVNSSLTFEGPSAALYDIRAIGAITVVPIRVNLR